MSSLCGLRNLSLFCLGLFFRWGGGGNIFLVLLWVLQISYTAIYQYTGASERYDFNLIIPLYLLYFRDSHTSYSFQQMKIFIAMSIRFVDFQFTPRQIMKGKTVTIHHKTFKKSFYKGKV